MLALAASSLVSLLPVAPVAAGTQSTANACQMSANGLRSNMDVTVTGTAAATSSTHIDLTGLSIATAIPDAVHLELYSLGYYTAGFNPVGLTAVLTITATNTTEDQQPVLATSSMQVDISDPDGIKGTGDETVITSPLILLPLPTTGWTPAGGEIQFSETAAAIITSHFFGTATATLACTPGTTPDRITVVPATPVPFEAITPPTPPVCTDTSVVSGKGLSTDVSVVSLCSDANGNLDPGSIVVVAGPTGGTTSVGPTGVLTYTNTDPSIGTDEVVVTIADTGGLVSAPITITLLVQALRFLEQGGSEITLATVTLDGGAHVALGGINAITITNLPTSELGFSVSAYATDLGAPEVPTTTLDLNGDGTSDVSVPACAVAGAAGRLCIPARNMGWVPRAAVVTDGMPGGGAAVQAGPPSASTAAEWMAQLTGATPAAGLSQPQLLCSAPLAAAIGTFRCDADLFLGVPASAGESTYRGLIVVTII